MFDLFGVFVNSRICCAEMVFISNAVLTRVEWHMANI